MSLLVVQLDYCAHFLSLYQPNVLTNSSGLPLGVKRLVHVPDDGSTSYDAVRNSVGKLKARATESTSSSVVMRSSLVLDRAAISLLQQDQVSDCFLDQAPLESNAPEVVGVAAHSELVQIPSQWQLHLPYTGVEILVHGILARQ